MDTIRRETLNVKEVAAIFGVSANSVYRWAHSGDVRLISLGTRRVLFPRAEIERILQGATEHEASLDDLLGAA